MLKKIQISPTLAGPDLFEVVCKIRNQSYNREVLQDNIISSSFESYSKSQQQETKEIKNSAHSIMKEADINVNSDKNHKQQQHSQQPQPQQQQQQGNNNNGTTDSTMELNLYDDLVSLTTTDSKLTQTDVTEMTPQQILERFSNVLLPDFILHVRFK
jgi:hypothetical protein